jgi:rubrerythrin
MVYDTGTADGDEYEPAPVKYECKGCGYFIGPGPIPSTCPGCDSTRFRRVR